jgi:hypothetical protein
MALQKGMKNNIDSYNLVEPFESKLNVLFKLKKCICNNERMSITT